MPRAPHRQIIAPCPPGCLRPRLACRLRRGHGFTSGTWPARSRQHQHRMPSTWPPPRASWCRRCVVVVSSWCRRSCRRRRHVSSALDADRWRASRCHRRRRATVRGRTARPGPALPAWSQAAHLVVRPLSPWATPRMARKWHSRLVDDRLDLCWSEGRSSCTPAASGRAGHTAAAVGLYARPGRHVNRCRAGPGDRGAASIGISSPCQCPWAVRHPLSLRSVSLPMDRIEFHRS